MTTTRQVRLRLALATPRPRPCHPSPLPPLALATPRPCHPSPSPLPPLALALAAPNPWRPRPRYALVTRSHLPRPPLPPPPPSACVAARLYESFEAMWRGPGLTMARGLGDTDAAKCGFIATPSVRDRGGGPSPPCPRPRPGPLPSPSPSSLSFTPPHTPQVSTRLIEERDLFLILASDGVWEFIDSAEVALDTNTLTLAPTLDPSPNPSPAQTEATPAFAPLRTPAFPLLCTASLAPQGPHRSPRSSHDPPPSP